MPRQTSIQVTEATEQQAKALKRYGTFTDVVRTAVDRMYNQERATQLWNMEHTDKTIEELVTEWQSLEAKHKFRAPEAMLRWCNLAMNSEDELVKLLKPVIERAIVRRELDLFVFRNDREESEDDIRGECCAEIRSALMTAKFMSTMSTPMDD